ncbi:MAG: hypothetical protein AB7O24_27070 [Kofleriaceae bacterium]
MNRLHSLIISLSLVGCATNGTTATGDDDDGSGGKADGSSSILFSAEGPSEFKLEGALEPAFRAAHAGEPDGIFPPMRVMDPFPGRVGYGDVMVDAELQLRGNSSIQECEFAKLKFKTDKAQSKDTAFDGARKIKIGTHCGEGGGGVIGRLREEKATWREAAIYPMMRALQMNAQLAKPVSFTYLDTSTNESLTRKAFIFEHIDLTAGRLGGEPIDDPETWTGDPAETMEMQSIVRAHFFEALVGNWDWWIKLGPSRSTGGQLWNVEAISFGDKLEPLLSDFDLSSAVTGSPIKENALDARVLPAEPDLLVRQAAHYLAYKFGSQFSDDELHAARDHFVERRADVEAVIEQVPIDDEGRDNLRAHVVAFYKALESLDVIIAAVRVAN